MKIKEIKSGRLIEMHPKLAIKALKTGQYALTTMTETKTDKEIMEDLKVLFNIPEERIRIEHV